MQTLWRTPNRKRSGFLGSQLGEVEIGGFRNRFEVAQHIADQQKEQQFLDKQKIEPTKSEHPKTKAAFIFSLADCGDVGAQPHAKPWSIP